jgi:hypothetical protein
LQEAFEIFASVVGQVFAPRQQHFSRRDNSTFRAATTALFAPRQQHFSRRDNST